MDIVYSNKVNTNLKNITPMNTIVSQFNIQGNVVEVAPLGNGLINTTLGPRLFC